MKTFRLSQLLTPWFDAKNKPVRKGWYRVRTERLKGAWWNLMAYFDGSLWWEFGRMANCGNMPVRREVRAVQWQGLLCPAEDAALLIRQHLPETPGARVRWTNMAKLLETSFSAPA